MIEYVIKGGNKLIGTTYVSGSKNSSLPIIAACILNGKRNVLYNIPKINDVEVMLEILEKIGCDITREENRIIIDSKNINTTIIPKYLMEKLRASIIIVGALLSRFKNAEFSYPGGCNIGLRPIDLHINNLKKLGTTFYIKDNLIKCVREKEVSKRIYLEFPSVGATENLILSSVIGKEKVVLYNTAMEPEISDLCIFLNKMGANIEGIGTSTIIINGVNYLNETSYLVMPDRIEAGTLMAAVAITEGTAVIENINYHHMEKVIDKFIDIGCIIEKYDQKIRIISNNKLKSTNIETAPYPGFPTDMQPIFASVLSSCIGESIISEKIFEKRFDYTNELRKLGADIKIYDNKAIIEGKRSLRGATTVSKDLRGGAALVIAGLAAEGKTYVENIDYILRGYDNLDIKLNSLGANIIRKEITY